jgi:hypothetical protein
MAKPAVIIVGADRSKRRQLLEKNKNVRSRFLYESVE